MFCTSEEIDQLFIESSKIIVVTIIRVKRIFLCGGLMKAVVFYQFNRRPKRQLFEAANVP